MTGNLAASILARLLTLAKQRGDDYSLLLNRFGMERLLARLSSSPHADRFLLKGALLFARSEGIVPAPESSHAVRAAIDESGRSIDSDRPTAGRGCKPERHQDEDRRRGRRSGRMRGGDQGMNATFSLSKSHGT